ncbi:preprotein translocase subunit SECE1 [Nymphaea colorata]|uniref:Preprotein translocase subunit SECE1 n=1 Tax=Nymphaea colorata TaxID=210225 RepID=A0A5K0Z0E7_9MAGN|nr:preprotein translocase subunit SECE1 [Nymphaea colorata]
MECALGLGYLSLRSFPRRKTLSPPPASSLVCVSPQISLRRRNSDRCVLFPCTRTPARPLTRSSTGESPEGSSEEAEGISRQDEKPGEGERKEAEPPTVLDKKEGSATGETLAGVLEEIRMIEWPEFGKVLGTTGVVLSVIAGSSVVLLTVNAVFAELSDRVFAGKGVQDFFG